MPKIRPYQARTSGGVGPVQQRFANADQTGNALTRFAQNTKNQIGQVEQIMQQKADFEASAKLLELQKDSLNTLEEMKKNAKPGAEGFSQDFDKFYQQRREKILEESGSEYQRNKLEMGMDRMGINLQQNANSYEIKQAGAYASQQFSDNLNGVRKAVVANPEHVESSWETVEASIATNPYFNETQKAQLTSQAKMDVYDDALNGEMINLEKNTNIKSGQIDGFINELKKDGNKYKSSSSPNSYKNALARLERFRDAKKKSEQTMDVYDFEQEMRYTETTGNDRSLYTPEQIKSWGLSERKTNDLLRKLDTAKEVAGVHQEIKEKPFNELLAEISNPNKMKELAADPDNFDKNVKKEMIKQRLVVENYKRFKKDPAQYVLDQDPSASNLYDKFKEDPQNGAGAYASYVIEKQRELDPSIDPSILPASEVNIAKNIMKNVAGDPEGAKKALTYIQNQAQTWGEYYPTIVKDLKKEGALNGSQYHASAMFEYPETRDAAELLIEADTYDNKELNAAGVTSQNDARKEIMDLMGDFKDTMARTTPQSYKDNYEDLVDAMAKAYRYSEARGLGHSAQDIYDKVVASRYTFEDGRRLPKKIRSWNPKENRVEFKEVDNDVLEAGINGVMSFLNDAQLAPIKENMSEAEMREYRSRVMRGGQWVNNGDKGLMLLDPSGGEVRWRFNQDEQYSKVERTFEEFIDNKYDIQPTEIEKARARELAPRELLGGF